MTKDEVYGMMLYAMKVREKVVEVVRKGMDERTRTRTAIQSPPYKQKKKLI